MKVKIILESDKHGEMGDRKVTIERNNTDFETILKDLLGNWLKIDFQRPHNEFLRALVEIGNKYLERPHLGWILEMKPKESVFQRSPKKPSFSFYGQNGMWYIKIDDVVLFNYGFHTKKDMEKATAVAEIAIAKSRA